MRKKFFAAGVALVLASLVFMCGKKAPPLPPIVILPKPVAEAKVSQSGDTMVYSFLLPAISTDERTPVQIGTVEIYRLKEPRVAIATPEQAGTQTAPAGTTQSQPVTPQPQTQTQPQTAPAAPATQTAPVPAGTQTAPAQTQPQTQSQPQTQPAPPAETARQIQPAEFESRAEKMLEVDGTQLAAYLRDGYFYFTEKVNLQPESEDLKNWYYYGVRVANLKGRESNFSDLVALFPVAVPAQPSNFTASFDEKGVHLNWSQVKTEKLDTKTEQTVYYNIYRGETANFAPRAPINSAPLSTTSYDDATAQFGKPYYYFVRSTLSSTRPDNESNPSNVILILPQDTFAPKAPEELNVVAAKDGMVLIWAPNQEADVAGYNIYRSTVTGKDYQKVNRGLIRETTFTDATAGTGQTYYYVVTAVDSAPVPNESGHSNEVSETRE